MVLSLAVLLVGGERGEARSFLEINLSVLEVRVTPIVAHVGDTIRFEMTLQNRGDAVDKSTTIEIKANGKRVASKLFRFGWSQEPMKVYRETFEWNTKGVPPGEYRIQGDAFVWGDSNEFDNVLDVKEPLVLLPVGAPLPAGKEGGGTAVGVN